jgi:hypothetical protein
VTAAQITMAARIIEDLAADDIVDLREIGSEGCVLRTIVPGPLRGQGTWLIARDGVAQAWNGEIVYPGGGVSA